MSFKPFVSLQSLLFFLNITFAPCAFSNITTPLNGFTGNLAAFSGGGYASLGDISFTDSNPAALAILAKQYTFSTAATVDPRGFQLYEVGNFDSIDADFAAALRLRQTTLNTGTNSIDRRLTLGFAYELPWIKNFSLGVSGDYSQLGVNTEKWGVEQNTNVRLGLFYGFKIDEIPINIGFGSSGFFSKYDPKSFGIGLSTVSPKGYYVLHSDMLLNENSGLTGFVTGITIFAQQYLDIKGSYGYNIKEERSFGAGGFFLKSEIVRLYYVIMRADTADKYVKQSFGLDILIAL